MPATRKYEMEVMSDTNLNGRQAFQAHTQTKTYQNGDVEISWKECKHSKQIHRWQNCMGAMVSKGNDGEHTEKLYAYLQRWIISEHSFKIFFLFIVKPEMLKIAEMMADGGW